MLSAAQNGNVTLMTSLLNANADVNAMDMEGETPLSAAAAGGELDMMSLLLSHGAEVNLTGGLLQWTAIHRAVAAGQDQSVDCLLRHNADLDKTDAVQRTPLLLAVMFRHVQCATVLLAAGADPNMGNKRFGSPLNLAASQGNDCMVEVLLTYGAFMETAPYALHNAIEVGSIDCVRMLLLSGADPNVHDRKGKTPLILAIYKSNPELVKCLLQHNCDTELKSKFNIDMRISRQLGTVSYTPLLLAEAWQSYISTALLLMAGADTNGLMEYLENKPHHGGERRRTRERSEWISLVKSFVHTPRSLKQLSRTVTRKVMPAVKFYTCLNKLPLPRMLKDYVGLYHLETIDESDYANILAL